MTMTAPPRVSMRDRLRTDYQWTARQREVLALIARGKTNTQIGEELGITLDGAKWHVSEILSKLQADQREEAAEYWRRYNGVAPRFERIFRGVTGALATKWVAGTAAVVVAGAATAVIVAIAINQSSDEPRRSDAETSTAEAALVSGTPSTSGGAGAPETTWGWNSDRPSTWIWLASDAQNVAASYGKEFPAPDDSSIEPGGIALLSAADGMEMWRVPLNSHAFPAAMLDDRLVFGTADGAVYALDRGDGRELWKAEFPGLPFQVVDAGPVIIVADADPAVWGPSSLADPSRLAGRVWALDAETGELRWSLDTPGTSAFVTTEGSLVVVASSEAAGTSQVVAVEASSGRELWRRTTHPVAAPPLIHGDSVLLPGTRLAALELASGEETWSVEPGIRADFMFLHVMRTSVAAGTRAGTVEIRALADGGLVAATPTWNQHLTECPVVPFALDGQLMANVCGGVSAIDHSGGIEASWHAFWIPQGRVDSLTISGSTLVVSSGIGGVSPEGVTALRRKP